MLIILKIIGNVIKDEIIWLSTLSGAAATVVFFIKVAAKANEDKHPFWKKISNLFDPKHGKHGNVAVFMLITFFVVLITSGLGLSIHRYSQYKKGLYDPKTDSVIVYDDDNTKLLANHISKKSGASWEDAVELTMNTSNIGNISAEHNPYFFRFTLDKTSEVKIRIIKGELNSLTNKKKNDENAENEEKIIDEYNYDFTIYYDDDLKSKMQGFEITDSVFTEKLILGQGTYYLELSSPEITDSSSADFTMELSDVTNPSMVLYEMQNSSRQDSPIEVLTDGQYLTSRFDDKFCENYYSFELDEASEVWFQVQSYLPDTELKINVISLEEGYIDFDWYIPKEGALDNAKVKLPKGKYEFSIYKYYSNSTKPYGVINLSITATKTPFEYFVCSNSQQPYEIEFDTEVGGYYNGNGSAYYMFDLKEATNVEFIIQSEMNNDIELLITAMETGEEKIRLEHIENITGGVVTTKILPPGKYRIEITKQYSNTDPRFNFSLILKKKQVITESLSGGLTINQADKIATNGKKNTCCFSNAEKQRYYMFELQNDSEVFINHDIEQNNNITLDLKLMDLDENEKYVFPDSHFEENCQLPKGKYYLVISTPTEHISPDAIVSFTLEAEEDNSFSGAGGNNFRTASELTTEGKTIESALVGKTTEFYKYTLESNSDIEYTIKNQSEGIINVGVYDEEENNLFIYPIEDGKTETIKQRLNSGDYYVSIEKSDTGKSEYSMSLKIIKEDVPESIGGIDEENAVKITVGEKIQGNLDQQHLAQYYLLKINASTKLVLESENECTISPLISVYPKEGDSVIDQVELVSDYKEEIQLEKGTYIIEVKVAKEEFSNYGWFSLLFNSKEKSETNQNKSKQIK